MQITLPKTPDTPETHLEWKIPQWSNAIERDRARIYFVAYAAGCAFHFLDKAFEEIRAGRTKTFENFDVPDEAIGCGFHEAVRGVLSHHMVIRDGKIANYHPYPPTPWNGSPTDSYGTPGPYEDACNGMPIFEEADAENFRGIDIMRAVRSFDPCLPCGVHMYLGNGRTIKQVHSPMFGEQRMIEAVEALLDQVESVPEPQREVDDRARAGAAGHVRRGAGADRRGGPGAGRGRARRAPAAVARAASGAAWRSGWRARWTRCARTCSRTAAASSCSGSTTASCGCGWRARATAVRPPR